MKASRPISLSGCPVAHLLIWQYRKLAVKDLCQAGNLLPPGEGGGKPERRGERNVGRTREDASIWLPAKPIPGELQDLYDSHCLPFWLVRGRRLAS